MDDLTTRIALYDNGDCLVVDERAATLINPDLTTTTWWKETPHSAHWTALENTKLEPIVPSKPMLLQCFDIGHRFETDPRRKEALNLLIQNIK